MELKNLIIVFLALMLALPSLAQVGSSSKEISAVKLDTAYLYAEATMKDPQEAILGAKSILEMTVGDWLRQQHPGEAIELCIAKAKENTQELQTKRGDFYRAFVYVKKDDILPVTDTKEIVVFQVGSPSQEPTQLETTPQQVATENSNDDIQAEVKTKPTLTPDELQMIRITKFSEVGPYINDLKAHEKIKDYGKYSSLPAEGQCYLFVYDVEGEIRAVMHKIDGMFVNLRSQQEEDIKKYKNCGAIWFRFK